MKYLMVIMLLIGCNGRVETRINESRKAYIVKDIVVKHGWGGGVVTIVEDAVTHEIVKLYGAQGFKGDHIECYNYNSSKTFGANYKYIKCFMIN